MKFANDSTDREHNLHTSTTSTSPRRRFLLWILIVCAAIAAPLWSSIAGAPIPAAAQSLIALAAFLHLLKTTPPNAIKLPWAASAAIILLAAALLPTLAHADFNPILNIPPLILTLLLLALLFNPSSPMSPWWATLVVWHPAFWITDEPALHAWNTPAILIRVALLLAGVTIYAAANAWRSIATWSIALASAIATLLLILIPANP